MSDSFADLWNSTAPSKPQQPPQRLGSITPGNTSLPTRPKQDVFSLLSSAASSTPNSRPITPSTTGYNSSQQRLTTPNPITKPTSSSGGDAFSGLLSGSLSTANGSARMTIAERAAEVERQKLESLRRHHQHVKTQAPSAWDGLDTLVKSTTPVPAQPSAVATNLDDDWGFDSLLSQEPATQPDTIKPTPPPVDYWTGNLPTAPDHLITSQPWGSTASSSSQSPPLPERKRSDSPGDFDFGNREDALLDDDSNDEDDILGALSKPVDSISRRKSPLNHNGSRHDTPSPPPPPRHPSSVTNNNNNKASSRPVSPPPHILGQIVEMGFSVQQARIALASTDTGLDVQAALETLLSNGAGASSSSSIPTSQPQSPDFPSGQQPRSATRLMQQHDRDIPSPSNSQADRDRDRNIQEQADKLLAQASEIGLSMFSKASSFWKEGKERVQKAYVERTAAVAGVGVGVGSVSTPGGGGRPKWMQETTVVASASAAVVHDDGWNDTHGDSSAFSDDVLPPRPKPKRRPAAEPSKPQPKPADLFSDAPVAYVSPFRRGKSQQPAAALTPPPPPRPTSPIRPVPRQNLITASASSISRSAQHKDAGAAKFKLGQYADAEASYTAAIACLPASHLLLVPLYNNRSLMRLKTGDHTGAIDDATAAIEIVGLNYHPAKEARVERREDGAEVELGDALVKALKRRAEAWEGREKWDEARRDWEVLAAMEWAPGGVRGEAVRGAGRCRRMGQAAVQSPDETRPPAQKPKPKPKPKPAHVRRPAAAVVPSQALENLRTASNVAEAEDQQRYELKDSVDARLIAWKGGKETNIRALLGSLDAVLWPELGLQKVGMADLVSPSQVKIRYTRTIAKLHPDKLHASNTTVEQRMIANGVFGALNEAWNAFKQ
ncbi:UBA domain-containing protein 7 [Hypsizygus marmoreus]|uniref:UBA domain-containing protein 7 n=1 Tax=Hypsizygus marmoreus TaxID=39966 RepID=A0A369JFK7_HYPMA|nr:UBA domain-containing protein 7 [Hypsizygus marmoreus]